MLRKGKEITGHSAAIYTIDGNQQVIYTGSGDHFVASWNIDSGEQANFSIKAEESIYSLKLVNDKTQLVFGTSSGAVHVIDLVNRTEIKHFIQHKVAIFSIVENTFRNHIYITDADGNLSIWQAENWNLLLFLPLQTGKIRDILVSKDGKLIFLACQDGKIRVLESTGYNEIIDFHAHIGGTNCLLIHPSHPNFLISGGKDGHLRIWDWQKEKMLLEIPAHNFGIYRLVSIQDGKYVVSASRDKTIKLWDVTNFNVLQRIERKHYGHSHAVNDLYKVDEETIVSVGDDKRINVWHWKNDEAI